MILNDDYKEYNEGFEKLNLLTLYQRRITLCENFALQTAKHNKLHTMFPRSEKEFNLKIRNPEQFKVNMALTERYKNSSIPYMQRLLNKLEQEKITDTAQDKQS